jgi:hypothetical protein
VLEIRYTGNSFAAPQRMRFRYQLDGHDRDWRDDEDNRRTAIYTGLHPGRYTFRVTACNNHGIWNEQPAEFSFTLAPQFWQTWWFYVLAAMGLLALGGDPSLPPPLATASAPDRTTPGAGGRTLAHRPRFAR